MAQVADAPERGDACGSWHEARTAAYVEPPSRAAGTSPCFLFPVLVNTKMGGWNIPPVLMNLTFLTAVGSAGIVCLGAVLWELLPLWLCIVLSVPLGHTVLVALTVSAAASKPLERRTTWLFGKVGRLGDPQLLLLLLLPLLLLDTTGFAESLVPAGVPACLAGIAGQSNQPPPAAPACPLSYPPNNYCAPPPSQPAPHCLHPTALPAIHPTRAAPKCSVKMALCPCTAGCCCGRST